MNGLTQFFADRPLVLASKSPRRQALLRMLELDFIVYSTEVDESFHGQASPEQIVRSLAQRKAEAASKAFPKAFIVAADTIVVLDHQILGKPGNAEDAKNMLRQLSGRTHEVFTGYTLLVTPQRQYISGHERTAVTFHEMSDADIDAYVARQNPLDKAGAYGIQDTSAVFIKGIEGCFYNVMGFPLANFYRTSCRFLTQFNAMQDVK